MAAPLLAFGGWADADWFSPSLLSDQEVVAFELPKLPGARRQGFHIIDRSMARAKSAKGAQVPERAPKRLAGRLAVLLDAAGALRAVASCRSALIFERGPVLFFADIPTRRLKARAANKLRRDVIGLGMAACTLRSDEQQTTLMFWPAAEQDIAVWVQAARPDRALHAEFEGGPLPVRGAGRKQAEDRRGQDREARLLRQIAVLQTQLDELTRAQSAAGAMRQLGLDDDRLKSMLKLLHPDKHGGSQAATEAATWLNAMRELLKARPA